MMKSQIRRRRWNRDSSQAGRKEIMVARGGERVGLCGDNVRSDWQRGHVVQFFSNIQGNMRMTGWRKTIG